MKDLINRLMQLVEPSQPAPQPFVVIAIRVPAETPWQPQVAEHFMVSAFAQQEPLRFQIRALPDLIEWTMVVPAEKIEAIIKTIYAFFPQAQVRGISENYNPADYTLYNFQLARPFVSPLKYAEDFRHYAPLAVVLTPMTALKPGEEIIYELALYPISKRHRALAEKMITASIFTWKDYLTVSGTATALAYKVIGADKTARFETPIQNVLQAKLNAPLKAAYFMVKVKAATLQRAGYLAGLFHNAFAQFEREGFNRLVLDQYDSFPLVLSPPEIAAMWHLPTTECSKVSGIQWVSSLPAPLPTPLVNHNRGILLGINTYQRKIQKVWLDDSDRVTHVNIIGKTRVGKSTLLHHMIHQDIASGKGVAVIDPHGDLVNAILATSIPPDRIGDVVLFDVSDTEYPIGLNFLTTLPGVSHEVTAGHALAIIRKLFAEQWSPLRMEDSLHAALMALVTLKGATLQDIPKLFSDAEFRLRVLAQVQDPTALEFWQQEYGLLSPSNQLEYARPINSRIRKFYRNPNIRRIICQRTSLDFGAMIGGNKIFLANLHGTSDIEGEVLGSLLISQIQLATMSRARRDQSKRRVYYLYVDEVQNFVTTSLATMFAEAGKYGLSLAVANQYFDQLAGDTREAILGNVGTTIIFRLGQKDAEVVVPTVKPHFTATNLTNLNRFNAIVKMQLGGETLPAFSMKTLPPPGKPQNYMENVDRIKAFSRKQYGRPAEAIDEEIAGKNDPAGQTGELAKSEKGKEEVDYFG